MKKKQKFQISLNKIVYRFAQVINALLVLEYNICKSLAGL